MSTSSQKFPALTTAPERRFYPRIVPQAPLFVAFHENEPGTLLLNVSENGLLVSTPTALTLNSVARLSINLSGLPKPVQVTVCVVWASEAGKLAGIQLLDLSEHDRQQIRKWGARESWPSCPPDRNHPLLVVPPREAPSDTEHATGLLTEGAASSTARDIVPLAPPILGRQRATPIVERCAMWGLYLAAACLVIVFFVRNEALGNLLSRSSANSSETSASAAVAVNSGETLRNPNVSTEGAFRTPASPASNLSTPKPSSVVPAAAAAQHAVQTRKAFAGTASTPLRTSAAETKRDISQTHSILPQQSASEINLNPAVSRPATENPAAEQNDLSETAATPSPDDQKRANGSTFNKYFAPAEATPEAPPGPPDSAPNQALSNPMRPADTPGAAATTILPSAPATPHLGSTVAPTRSAISPNSDPTVIQMDPPRKQTLEVHLPGGSQASFLNLPGERVVESPTVTIHIQRSVLMPASHGWFSNRNKKVVVGELIARADPQATEIPATARNSVRVKAGVAKDGHIENVSLILGPANLAPAVAKALQEWRYQPTLVDSKPVETQCYLVFQFHPPSYRALRR